MKRGVDSGTTTVIGTPNSWAEYTAAKPALPPDELTSWIQPFFTTCREEGIAADQLGGSAETA
jgi:hypothetical protein